MADIPEPPPDRSGRVVDMFTGEPVGGRPTGLRHLLKVLAKGDKGVVLGHLANVMLMLAHDPAVAGMFGFNEFTGEQVCQHAPPFLEELCEPQPGPYPRPWTPADLALVQAYLQRTWCPKISRQTLEEALPAEAMSHRFHPVADWLASLAWDGTPRLDTWLCRAFGARERAYERAVGALVLVAAVRRVRHPGCKFDTLVLLEGAQGIGKSKSLAALFGAAFYSDNMPPNLADRDAALALRGVWCMELAEIEHLIRAEVETIKAFLSRPVDRIRPPYGKGFLEYPRQGVLIGTTNESDYLRDASGNRRMLPVACQFADVAWIEANREQLWAEAAARERAGEAIWLAEADMLVAAEAQQQARMAEDVWEAAIIAWLAGVCETTVPAVLSGAISMPLDRQDKRAQMRVANVLRKLKWTRRLARRSGPPLRLWLSPAAAAMDASDDP